MDITYRGMKAAWWLILLEGLAILGGSFLQMHFMNSGIGEYAAMALSQFSLIVPLAAGFLYLKRCYVYDSIKNLVAVHGFEPSMVFVLLVLPSAVQCFAAIVQLPFTEFLVRLFGSQTDTIVPRTVEDLIWLFLSLCVAAPILEELFFRGIIFKLLEPYGTVAAVCISAFGFAILHFHPSVLLMIFIVGIVVGFVRLYSGSVTACILFHAVFNFESLLQIVYSKELESLGMYTGIYVLVMACMFPILSVVGYLCWGKGKGRSKLAGVKAGGLVPMLICLALFMAISVFLAISNGFDGGF